MSNITGSKFIGDCRRLPYIHIENMLDKAVEVAYDELVAYVGRDELIEKFPVYDWNDVGLQLEDDWAVHFYRSEYDGIKVYYVNWSSIEFIWSYNEI